MLLRGKHGKIMLRSASVARAMLHLEPPHNLLQALIEVFQICPLCPGSCTFLTRPLIRAYCITGQAEHAAKSLVDAHTVPEQQPEGPLGIENAKLGAKEGFEKHGGHGRLYRPQATLARPPASGEDLVLLASVPMIATHMAIALNINILKAPLCRSAML